MQGSQKGEDIETNLIEKKEEENKIKKEIFIKMEEKIIEEGIGFSGIPDKKYFIQKQKLDTDNTYFLNLSDFELTTIEEDENSGYRALSLQIFGSEEKYREVRNYIYTFLLNNKDNITKYYFERNGEVMNAVDYSEIIKSENEPLGDLELFSFAFLFNTEIIIFELKDNQKLSILSECGKILNNDNNKNKIFLNLCLVKGCQFQVIYEKNKTKNYLCNKDDLDKIIEINIKKQNSLDFRFEYPKDTRKNKYRDIEKYLSYKNMNQECFPDYISSLSDENKKKYKQKEFAKVAKKYSIDKRIGRLKISFNISNKVNLKCEKDFFIVYQFEKIHIITKIHEIITHNIENCKSLDKMVKEYDFWWYGIYQDVKNYQIHCPLCKK